MMENIRAGVQKTWFKVILGVVIVSFIFAGYFTGSVGGTNPNTVALVNGQEVDISELNNAVNQEAARYGEQFATLFSTEERQREFQRTVLEKLINSKIIAQKVESLGFRASPEQVVEQVTSIPSLQLDGQFSTQLLDQALRSRGWSRDMFQQMMAEDIAQAQFLQVITDTQITTNEEAIERLQLEQQQRSARYSQIPASFYREQLSVTEEEIQAYYNANTSKYEQAESLTVDYIELSLNSMLDKVEVTEQQITDYYQGNQDLYRAEEERRVAHILLTTDERSEDEAQAKAEELKAEIDAGSDFAEIARANSDDFSAADGGDLGFIARGSMDEAFEEAAFALEAEGSVSSIVETEFGLHIIKLLEVRDGQTRPLEEVKDSIVERIKRDQAEREYFETKTRMKQLAFENPDLVAAAAEAQLDIKTSEPFTRTGGQGVFANADVVSEAYSDAVLNQDRNSQAIDVSEEQMIILRANTYTPASIIPLEEVSTQVAAELRQQKARDQARLVGEELIAQINSDESVDATMTRLGMEWQQVNDIRRNSSELGFELTGLVFEAPKPSSDKTFAFGKSLLNGDFAIIEVTEVSQPEVSALTQEQIAQAKLRLQRISGDASYEALVAAVRAEADITIFEERLQ